METKRLIITVVLFVSCHLLYSQGAQQVKDVESVENSSVLQCVTMEKGKWQTADKYKNRTLPVEVRVADLLSRMTVEEKVGQLTCMLGWEMYDRTGDGVEVSDKFREAVAARKVGMLWAMMRADPWTQKTLANGLNPELAAEAANAMQRYIIENTRLGIPLFIAEESMHGHMAIGTTVFPTSIGQASTWNPESIEQMAAVIAEEVRLQGAHIGYGPVLDMARDPRWSRTEETFGEDPLLIARMGEAMVRGFQGDNLGSGRNVISTLKHLAAYGNPEGGHNGGSVSIGLRELRRNHLYPFERAVKAGALSVMSAYNSIDGIPCTASEFLFTDLLRGEWGFEGFGVSDLGSIEGIRGTHRVAETIADASLMALNAGVDVDLGGNAYSRSLADAVAAGRLDMAVLDRAVARVLRLKFEMGLFENPYVDPEKAKSDVRSTGNKEVAVQVARESIILLENRDNLLPLDKNIRRIAVIGPNADTHYNQLGDYTAPQERSNIVTVLDGIRRKVSPQTEVVYVKGCAIRDTTNTQITEAIEAARNADVAVVVVGGSSARDFKTEYKETGAATVSETKDELLSDMDSGEGVDRATLDLLGKQLDLLKAVHATGTPVVVVYIQGRPLDMNRAAESAAGVLCAWYPGQEGGTAIADVLFGDYNPAGRLPISVPRSVGQLPVYYNHLRPARQEYLDSPVSPLYPFGYGLSYTTFKYSDLLLKQENSAITVSFDLHNSGSFDGEEVVQVYISYSFTPVVVPACQLVAFQRVPLEQGASTRITLTIPTDDLMIYDAEMKRILPRGTYRIMVGSSSQEIRLEGRVEIDI